MSIYTDKKNKRLSNQFVLKGITYKKRLPEGTSKSDAEKEEIKWKHQLLFESKETVEARNILFEDFLVEYYMPYAESNHSKPSHDRDIFLCKELLKMFCGRTLRSIKPAEIERFKDIRAATPTIHDTPRKPATVARELAVVSKIFAIGVRNDFIDYNPCSRVDKPQFDNVQDKVLRPEDEEKFFAALKSDWARDICLAVLNAGLRQNDALGLRKENVDWDYKVLRLIQGKTKRKVVIPMNKTLHDLILSRWDTENDLLFPSPKTGKQGTSVKKAVIGASGRAKIGHLTVRDRRRTFGIRLDDLNVDSSSTAKLLGHGDLRSVHRDRRGTEILREAVEQLEKANPTKILPAPENEKHLQSVSA